MGGVRVRVRVRVRVSDWPSASLPWQGSLIEGWCGDDGDNGDGSGLPVRGGDGDKGGFRDELMDGDKGVFWDDGFRSRPR